MVKSEERQALFVRLVMLAVVAVLGTTYVLPLAGMAASGAWRAGLTYSLPVMVQVGAPGQRPCDYWSEGRATMSLPVDPTCLPARLPACFLACLAKAALFGFGPMPSLNGP